jgi:hypothetical protein
VHLYLHSVQCIQYSDCTDHHVRLAVASVPTGSTPTSKGKTQSDVKAVHVLTPRAQAACCSKIAEAEAAVSVNEKEWLVMHMHVHLQLDELRHKLPVTISCKC